MSTSSPLPRPPLQPSLNNQCLHPPPLAPYRNFSGGNKDSSLRAYARHLRSLISQSDVLIQILDARDPMGSRSLSTEALISAHPGKRLLFVLTKIDLVPKGVLQGWLEKLRETHATLAFKSTATLSGTGRASRKLHTHTEASASSAASTSLEGSTAATLLQLLKNYARSQPKGMSLTVGIFGQPNVGKSSLINSLVRSRACSVAPRPGETKTLQTVLLDRKVRLVDSPGVAMGGGGGGGASEDTTKDVLRGTVKLELVEDPITPVAEILRRADPVKVTKLYRLPPIESEEEEDGGYAGTGMDAVVEPQAMVPDLEARSPQQQHQVDFKSLRAGREEMDESDDEENDDDDASSFIFNHSDHGDEDDSLLDSTTPQHSNRSRGAIGYDQHDPMDFLLRLALTRGKMLRGGKPDVEGAARGVINDWNTGKIAWCVAPPARGRREKMADQKKEEGVERDDEMKPAATTAEAKTADAPTDETTVVSGFSDAFDLEGLFAQADAQIFGGSSTTSKGNAAPAPAPPAAPPINKTVLQAADVSASSLGKRGRGGVGAAGDESQDEPEVEEQDSDSDEYEEDAQPKRMQLQPPPTAAAAQGEDDEDMAPRSRAQPQRPAPSAEDKELSSFLETAAKDAARNASSLQQQQQQQQHQHQRPTGGFTPSGKPKRGQRNQHKKGVSNEEPEYLSRLAHKATLPTNVKKSVGKRDQYVEQEEQMMGGGGGGRAKKGKRGDERRKKRKMARREETRDGGVGVVSGLEGVRLGDDE